MLTCGAPCVLQALEQQVSQEESSSQGLRQEVLAKEHDVLELRTAMREVRLSPAPKPPTHVVVLSLRKKKSPIEDLLH